MAKAAWIVSVGKAHTIFTHDRTGIILVTLDSQPSGPGPPGCKSIANVAINGGLPAKHRQAMLSQLLAARASDTEVHIS